MNTHPITGPPLQPAPTGGESGARLLSGASDAGAGEELSRHLARYGPLPLPSVGGCAELIRVVEESGLTGRGGAAFPTGRKMRSVAVGVGRRVVVANGMESEPASCKDSTLLEHEPHLVLDGAAVAAEAIGADTVHLCLPRDRQDLVDGLTRAVRSRVEHGVDTVPVLVHSAPFPYVSSEETSLVRWLNGGDAKPMTVPPRPFVTGVAGRPTLINNVETLAHLALIARKGPAWFRGLGRADAPGSALVTVSGGVRRPGVYEAPMATTIGSIIDLAGGPAAVPRAVLVGGFFGTWLPAPRVLDIPYAPSDLAELGAGPGAGVLVVLPSSACGLAETASVLNYLAAQSARQCGPCYRGLPAVAQDFTALAKGRGDTSVMRRLKHRVGLLPGRGACRLPDGAAQLAASALRVFADDVHHHLSFGQCRGWFGARVVKVPVPVAPREEEWR
ncbi:SLBB domain-containing protein [Streptomyces sp. PTM05]|uniref:SLBB domain-containing protein n=1 Tax=Streptantibioticus parmotrematis TaxID=2873249 RepID=A0ABS7QV26_9ACTN|nr:NADH-ubiquinone oxidoreductase-F iron-sulfur binding region domain-containing protein [Streptantibioticus parmotrematis]MBY8887045.1 SLBB domain-containing protein [Streptantibioticus parmotrematis]